MIVWLNLLTAFYLSKIPGWSRKTGQAMNEWATAVGILNGMTFEPYGFPHHVFLALCD